MKIGKFEIRLNSQLILLCLIFLIWLCFGLVNPNILSVANTYSILSSALVPLMLALPQMLIIAMGGTDMSFTVVASISSYITLRIWDVNGASSVPLVFIILGSIGIGVVCYLINWFLVDRVKISTFIATLGVNSMLKGFVLAFVSSSYVNSLPSGLKAFSTSSIATAVNSEGVEYVLHVSIIFVIILYILLYFMMEKTMFGRKIYSIGADEDAARRAGINVSRVRLFAFILAGILCGLTGVLHDSLSRFSMPLPPDVVGKELNSIAAVVIGIGGSKKASGIVAGTFLGVILLQLVSSNLVMLGVPSYWQQFVSGVIILIGLAFQAMQFVKKSKR